MSGLDGLGWPAPEPAPEPSQKPDQLALIKKLATKKKRKRGNNASINRLLREVERISEIELTKTTL